MPQPQYRPLAALLVGRGFAVLAVNVDERHDKALAMMQRSPLSFPVIFDPKGVILAPSPVEGTAFAGATVGTFASTDALAGLSAVINWGPTATPAGGRGRPSPAAAAIAAGTG